MTFVGGKHIINNESLSFEEYIRNLSRVAKEVNHQGVNTNDERSLTFISCVYGVAERTASRYIRLGNLSDGLLGYVGAKVISVRTGVELSYLRDVTQQEVEYALREGYTITYAKACALRKLGKLGMDNKCNVQKICRSALETAYKKGLGDLLVKHELYNADYNEVLHAMDEMLVKLPKRKVIW